MPQADHKEPNQFVELLIQSNLPGPADDCHELTIKEIYKLKISPNFNPELLKKVVWILGRCPMILDWLKVKILLKPGATDFRKQINGLSVNSMMP